MMITIGITGGVGAGKSTVLDFLEEKYQAYVMKADEIGHLVMEPGQSCYEPVMAAMLDLGKGSGPMDHGFAIRNEYVKESEK